MTEEYQFDEKQYIGRDMTWISVRLILAIFSFVAAYINIDHFASQQLFLIVGIGVLCVSVVMLYLVMYRTRVKDDKLMLSGLWTTSLVKIDLKSIVAVEVKPYNRFLFNTPVYNLHKDGKIRFYAGGKNAVWLTDADGLQYVIGSQKPEELLRVIKTVTG